MVVEVDENDLCVLPQEVHSYFGFRDYEPVSDEAEDTMQALFEASDPSMVNRPYRMLLEDLQPFALWKKFIHTVRQWLMQPPGTGN